MVSQIAPIGGSSLFFRYGEKLLQKAGIAMAENAGIFASNLSPPTNATNVIV